MKHNKYSKEQLINAIKNSLSIRQSLLVLGIAPQGGNYRVIHKAINLYDIDTSHFTGQHWAKNKIFGSRRNIEDYLSNKQSINSFRLKNRLLKENIFSNICQKCKNTSWLNQKIPLELDHIDGNSENNELTNLRLLCPNCHAFTETYRGKNKKRPKLGSV